MIRTFQHPLDQASTILTLILYGAKLNQNDDYGRLNLGQGGATELRVQNSRQGSVRPVQITRSSSRTDMPSRAIAIGWIPIGCLLLPVLPTKTLLGAGSSPSPSLPHPVHAHQPALSDVAHQGHNGTAGDRHQLLRRQDTHSRGEPPGKRSPTSYAINLAMAHRDGRLTRD